MSDMPQRAIILGFPDYREPAERLAHAAGIDYAEVQLHTFPDGESLVRLPATLPPRVIFCRTLTDANRRLIELELATATARKLGAEHITLVAPYLCYMRQDSAFHTGEAVSQKIIGQLLARQVDALVTVDPHLHRTQHLADAVPVITALAISAAPLMTDWLSTRGADVLVLGPDEESEQWVRQITDPADFEYCIAHKDRHGDADVSIELPDADVTGRDIVIVDDVISTGHTVAVAAIQLAERGARSVAVLVTHALFADGAAEQLRLAGVREICSSDSIPHPTNQLELAGLLAAAIAGAG